MGQKRWIGPLKLRCCCFPEGGLALAHSHSRTNNWNKNIYHQQADIFMFSYDCKHYVKDVDFCGGTAEMENVSYRINKIFRHCGIFNIFHDIMTSYSLELDHIISTVTSCFLQHDVMIFSMMSHSRAWRHNSRMTSHTTAWSREWRHDLDRDVIFWRMKTWSRAWRHNLENDDMISSMTS